MRLILLGYTGTLVFLSVAPMGGAGQGQVVSWLLHVLAYLGLGVLVALSFPDRFDRRRIRSVVEVALFGLLLELVQLGLGTRTFSFVDIAMNTAGAALSWFTPAVREQLFPGSDDEGGEPVEDVRPGDIEGQAGRPEDMRMIGDRQQDQRS